MKLLILLMLLLIQLQPASAATIYTAETQTEMYYLDTDTIYFVGSPIFTPKNTNNIVKFEMEVILKATPLPSNTNSTINNLTVDTLTVDNLTDATDSNPAYYRLRCAVDILSQQIALIDKSVYNKNDILIKSTAVNNDNSATTQQSIPTTSSCNYISVKRNYVLQQIFNSVKSYIDNNYSTVIDNSFRRNANTADVSQ